jgi:hypothetical protein
MFGKKAKNQPNYMIKLSQLLKKGKNAHPEAPVPEINCQNCNTHYIGHYCPNCGQPAKEFDKPFSFVFYNFVGDFFAFDTRFLNTFIQLVFHPGKLTSEFFAGRRVRYAPPFRIFIFMSFLLFLLLQILTSRELNRVLEKAPSKINIAVGDSSSGRLKTKFNSDKNAGIQISTPDSLVAASENSRQLLNKMATKLEGELDGEKNIQKKNKKIEIIHLLRSPEQATSKALNLLSWAFFVLLPIFALLLKLVFIRRNQNYVRHLIFSIHLHSFIFFDFIVLILLRLILIKLPVWLVVLSILIIPAYFILSLRHFYRQGIFKIIAKSIVVSILYNIIFWFAVVGVLFLMVN